MKLKIDITVLPNITDPNTHITHLCWTFNLKPGQKHKWSCIATVQSNDTSALPLRGPFAKWALRINLKFLFDHFNINNILFSQCHFFVHLSLYFIPWCFICIHNVPIHSCTSYFAYLLFFRRRTEPIICTVKTFLNTTSN